MIAYICLYVCKGQILSESDNDNAATAALEFCRLKLEFYSSYSS